MRRNAGHRSRLVQGGEGFFNRVDGRQQSEVGVNHQLVAHAANFVDAQKRRFAAGGHVVERGHLDLPGHGLEVLAQRGRFHEDHVGTGLCISLATRHGRFKTLYRQCIGAGNDHKIIIVARVGGGLDLADHVTHWDDRFASQMPAALGPLLVFDVDASHAGTLIGAHGAAHIHHPAVAGVGIGDQWQAGGFGNALCVIGHLAHGQQANVGHAQTHGGGARTTHVDGFKTLARHQPRGQGVCRAGGHQGLGARQQFAQSAGHGGGFGGGCHGCSGCLVVGQSMRMPPLTASTSPVM